MGTRRDFLHRGFELAACAAAAPTALAAELKTTLSAPPPAAAHIAARMQIYKFITDTDSTQSTEFAANATARGFVTYASGSDITALWYHDLHPRWRQKPIAIAGMTSPEALFCLERLAWDHAMRVVFRASHTPLAEAQIQHRLVGHPAVLEQLACAYRDTACSWTAATTEALGNHPVGPALRSEATIVSGRRDENHTFNYPLISWLIAPTGRI